MSLSVALSSVSRITRTCSPSCSRYLSGTSIAPSLILPLPVVDLQDLSAAEQETAIRQRVQEEAPAPFALAEGPLIRTTLLKIGHEEQVFLLTLHHIITDGWSMGILFQELAALYQAACEGQPAELPPFPIQYVDYSTWQRQWLQGCNWRPLRRQQDR